MSSPVLRESLRPIDSSNTGPIKSGGPYLFGTAVNVGGTIATGVTTVAFRVAVGDAARDDELDDDDDELATDCVIVIPTVGTGVIVGGIGVAVTGNGVVVMTTVMTTGGNVGCGIGVAALPHPTSTKARTRIEKNNEIRFSIDNLS
jgi:hypothetical protein